MKNNLQLVILGFKLTAKDLLIVVPLMLYRNFPKMVPFAAFIFLCLFVAFPMPNQVWVNISVAACCIILFVSLMWLAGCDEVELEIFKNRNNDE